jgi:hypothetical protein
MIDGLTECAGAEEPDDDGHKPRITDNLDAPGDEELNGHGDHNLNSRSRLITKK